MNNSFLKRIHDLQISLNNEIRRGATIEPLLYLFEDSAYLLNDYAVHVEGNPSLKPIHEKIIQVRYQIKDRLLLYDKILPRKFWHRYYPTLEEVIAIFELTEPDKILPVSIHEPHSWRGRYSDVSFELTENVSVRDTLEVLKKATTGNYDGYKGNTYAMSKESYMHLDKWGQSEDKLAYRVVEQLNPEISIIAYNRNYTQQWVTWNAIWLVAHQ